MAHRVTPTTSFLSLDDWTAKAQRGEAAPTDAIRHTFETEVIKSLEPGSRRMKFVISTMTPDRDRDVVMPSGCQLDAYLKNPVVLWAHDYRNPPIGKALSITVESNRLVAEADFADAETYPFADTIYRLLSKGFLRATSIGFRPIKYAINEERRGYDFEECELLEFSVVPVPANAEALAIAASADGGDPVDLAPVKAWIAGVESAQTAESVIEVKVELSGLEAVLAKLDALTLRFDAATPKALDLPIDDGEMRLFLAEDEDLTLSLDDDAPAKTADDLLSFSHDDLLAEMRAVIGLSLHDAVMQSVETTVTRVLAEARGRVV